MTERYDCGRCYQLRVERDRASQRLGEVLQELRRVRAEAATGEAAIRADERERWKQSHGGLVAEIEREARAEVDRLRAELTAANHAVAEAGVVNPGEPLEARIWTLGMTIRTLRAELHRIRS